MKDIIHTLPHNRNKISIELDDPPCAGQTDVFYPSVDEGVEQGTVKQQSDEAKAVCEDCPFKTECLETAVANGERFGIWGGVNFGNQRERRRFFDARKKFERKAS